MSEEEEAEKKVTYSFWLPRDPSVTLVKIEVRYETVRLGLQWEDTAAGRKQFEEVLTTLPEIITTVRQERAVRKELGDMDKDLLDLLSEGDDDAGD